MIEFINVNDDRLNKKFTDGLTKFNYGRKNILSFKTNTIISEKVNSFYFTEKLNPFWDINKIVVTDMGTSFTCKMQFLKQMVCSDFLLLTHFCSMGFELPAAIGAY